MTNIKHTLIGLWILAKLLVRLGFIIGLFASLGTVLMLIFHPPYYAEVGFFKMTWWCWVFIVPTILWIAKTLGEAE